MLPIEQSCYWLAIRHFGEPEARRLARLGEANLAEMLRFLDQRGIACDYEPTGRLVVALNQEHLEDARRSVDVAHRLVTRALRRTDRGESASLWLRLLDRVGIGFSS
jgi:hypothetical protein